MICAASQPNHFYIYDDQAYEHGWPLALVWRKPRIQWPWGYDTVLVRRLRFGLTRLGTIEVRFDESVKLCNFAWPLRLSEHVLMPGLATFELLNVDLPHNQYLRNIDIAILPGTSFGLAFGGLVTCLSRQQRVADMRQAREDLIRLLKRRTFLLARSCHPPA